MKDKNFEKLVELMALAEESWRNKLIVPEKLNKEMGLTNGSDNFQNKYCSYGAWKAFHYVLNNLIENKKN